MRRLIEVVVRCGRGEGMRSFVAAVAGSMVTGPFESFTGSMTTRLSMSALRGAWRRRLSWLGYWNMASPSAAGECSTEYGVLDREKICSNKEEHEARELPLLPFTPQIAIRFHPTSLIKTSCTLTARSCTANC